jgi:uncharacterized SAM-binding protein YcdF (DUF218 family)
MSDKSGSSIKSTRPWLGLEDNEKKIVNPRIKGLPKVLRAILCLLAALGLLVFLVTVMPVDGWLGRELAGSWNDPDGDVLIVLGGGSVQSGILNGTSYLRVSSALLAYKNGHFKTLFISGGGRTPTASAMADFFRCHGVPADAIIVEDASESTRENALFTRNALARIPGTKVLLTSDYHMFRAYRTFKNAGIEVLPRPIPDATKRNVRWDTRWPAFLDICEELVKISYYEIRGWLSS